MTTTIQALRSVNIDTLKRRGEVAYWIERPYGAMTGSLACRACYDATPALRTAADVVTPLLIDEACALANTEGQPPLCDECGKDIRS